VGRNVDIEYAGGTRPNLIDESCILLVDFGGDRRPGISVHIRQCIHAGVHHFAGNLHVHRKRDRLGLAAREIQVVRRRACGLDSTSIRGSGQMG